MLNNSMESCRSDSIISIVSIYLLKALTTKTIPIAMTPPAKTEVAIAMDTSWLLLSVFPLDTGPASCGVELEMAVDSRRYSVEMSGSDPS